MKTDALIQLAMSDWHWESKRNSANITFLIFKRNTNEKISRHYILILNVCIYNSLYLCLSLHLSISRFALISQRSRMHFDIYMSNIITSYNTKHLMAFIGIAVSICSVFRDFCRPIILLFLLLFLVCLQLQFVWFCLK